MKNLTPQPTDWHRKPKGVEGHCSICGIPDLKPGEHRRTDAGPEQAPVWIKRRKTADGWKHLSLHPKPRKKMGPKPGTCHFSGIMPKTEKQIARAAMLAGLGKTMKEIGRDLGVTPQTVARYRNTYPTLWKEAGAGAAERVIEIVRQQAGTEAVLAEIDVYLALAKAAAKAASQRGEDLFPADGKMTMTRFLEEVYVPMRLTEASGGTIEQMRVCVKLWRLITGDPPIEEITHVVLARFRDALAKSIGLDKVSRYSPNTTRSKMRIINGLLGKAGPPGPRNRDAVGIIEKVPWVQSPRQDVKIPRVVSPEHLEAVYLAAVCMEVPQVYGVKPPRWWKALLAVAYNTALRIGTLLTMRMEHVDWQRRLLVIPAANMKSRRPIIMPLNDVAFDHLMGIRTDRELVFPFHARRREFHIWVHKLQDEAGIPRKEHFGFHDIRRTAATVLCQTSLTAAQLALGHTSPLITMQHYINPHAEVARGLNAMPQPAAFRANGNGNGHDNSD